MKLLRIAAVALAALAASPSLAEELKWNDWSDDLFTRAAAEKRFVILDLEAVWCHWCHVMEKTTYADPEVTSLLSEKYLPVRVDQDANPDLSSRYGDWGWPATIIFAPDGSEIAFVSGGDIWTVPAAGGQARLLISHAANETRPVYSPDKSQLAFVSTRTGGGDVYVLTLASGDVRRSPSTTGWNSWMAGRAMGT